MALNPQYADNPRSESVEISASNTNRDGTGTIVQLIQAVGEIGTIVDRIYIKATGTTTAGMFRIFKREGSGSWKLYDEIPVTAITPSASLPTFRVILNVGEVLKSGDSFGVSTHNAESFIAHAFGGDF
jgi:hypothetical protein